MEKKEKSENAPSSGAFSLFFVSGGVVDFLLGNDIHVDMIKHLVHFLNMQIIPLTGLLLTKYKGQYLLLLEEVYCHR